MSFFTEHSFQGKFFKTGDHLMTPRIGYTHHGIYVGNGQVIHYGGFATGLSKGAISMTTVEAFSAGHSVEVATHLERKYGRKTVVGRAYSRLGEDLYNLLINNCEHFVAWCLTGDRTSAQVEGKLSMAISAATIYAASRMSTMAPPHTLFKETEKEAAALMRSGWGRQMFNSCTMTAARETAKTSTTQIARVAISGSSGTFAGLTSSSTVAAVTVGFAGVVGGASIAPLLVSAAVGVGVSYVVSEAFNAVWDFFD